MSSQKEWRKPSSLDCGIPEQFDFNPMQKKVDKYNHLSCNMVVASPTASGKSMVVVMRAFKHLFYRKRPKKLVYIAPMKSLVEEKKAEWSDSDHPFSDLEIAIVTGDYVGTEEYDAKKLKSADVIVITPESFSSRLRNNSSTANSWMNDIGIIAIDEFHLIGVGDRGATLEAALMEFTYIYPDVEILALSATMPNVEDLSTWLAQLNNHETILVKSKYRPVKLNVHIVPMYSYQNMLDSKRQVINKIRKDHSGSQILHFVTAKTFGNELEQYFMEKGISTAFHNADKSKQERESIERKFKKGIVTDLIATQTLVAGVNLPARIVIVTSIRNGGGDLHPADIMQAMGRAGRPKYDTEGDAYVLIPGKDQNEIDYYTQYVTKGIPISSVLGEPRLIGLHFLGAIALGHIKHRKDFYRWYRRSLYYWQNQHKLKNLDEKLDSILLDLEKRSMCVEEEGRIRLKARGKISSQMSVDPYYLYDLCANFRKYFALLNPDDLQLAWALSHCEPFYSYEHRDLLRMMWAEEKGAFRDGYKSAGVAYHRMIIGEKVPYFLFSTQQQIFQDIERIQTTLKRLNSESERWNKEDEIKGLHNRVKYGLPPIPAKLMAEGATKAQALKLAKNGITSMSQRQDPMYRKVFREIIGR